MGHLKIDDDLITQKPNAMIVDIDGVLCDSNARLRKYADTAALERGDHNAWRASLARYNSTTEGDALIREGLLLLKALESALYPVQTFFVTSRGSGGRDSTLSWLQKFINQTISSEELFMNPICAAKRPGVYWEPGDPIFDHISYKRGILNHLRKDWNIVMALDDYDGLAQMYYEEGVPTLHVMWPGFDCVKDAGYSHDLETSLSK